ncbi:sugar phosphate isomerase/epimerase family protein [Virgibacillus dokdonensis]|uniref:Sugar phosphate isomerase/epimerase family protein n=1 Tax=Virgibacillus dokdonensis TaxID=302167 RepID=A0ABU7VIL9_9BACI|nr:sugar phosphate isomerase/epimerase family protein [Virgibacillus dokdonensis]
MSTFYISSSLCWSFHPQEVIHIAKQYGCIGVEMWAEHMYYHQASPEDIRETAKAEQVDITLHAASWDLNICSLNQGIQQQSIVELKKSIDLAAKLGALHMTFHPGKYTVKNYLTACHQENLVTNTQLLLDYAKEKQVTLSQELMEVIPKEMLTYPEQMTQFQAKLNGELCVTLDIAHVPLQDDPINYFEHLQHVNSIHLSDSTKTQYHVPLGKGSVELHRVLTYFSKLDKPIVLEGMDTTKELAFLKQHIAYLNHHHWLERKIDA